MERVTEYSDIDGLSSRNNPQEELKLDQSLINDNNTLN